MKRRSLNPFREIALLIRIWRLFRREKPDIVHGFTIKCAIYGSFAARIARIPARVSAVTGMGYVFISNDWTARALRPAVQALMRIALGGANSRLVLQNEDDEQLFVRNRIVGHSRIRIIEGSGVDCRRFVPRTSEGTKNSRFTVLLAARMLWDKGIAEFVHAARLFRLSGFDALFVLAGSPDQGNPASVPKPVLHAWQTEGTLKWLGHVDDMRPIYEMVDAVALPSYREGLPKSLIEAAACGLPVVATDVPGCRAVVEHQVDGLLVPVGDPQALYEAIRSLIEDESLAARLGEAARRKAQRRFDDKAIIQQTCTVYRELLPFAHFSHPVTPTATGD